MDSMTPRRGAHNTQQKRLIEDCLSRRAGQHTTAEEIVGELRERGTPVGKTTVYRVLKQLEDASRVRKYMTGESDCACYQLVADECLTHYHAVCGRCGSVLHMHSQALRELSLELKSASGFHVDDTKLIIYGVCAACVGGDA